LVRKIKKLKRAKEQGEEGVDEKLYEERVMLNYVLVSLNNGVYDGSALT
jgi:hypothetical protein